MIDPRDAEIERLRSRIDALESERDEWMRRWMEAIHQQAPPQPTTTVTGCPHDIFQITTAGMICSRCGKQIAAAPTIYVSGGAA